VNTTQSKTKISYYRRLYIAYLIDNGINTVPLIIKATSMPQRTIQAAIKALPDYDITCEYIGADKNGNYIITEWSAINKKWVNDNLQHIISVL
jgi:hypothetical protein